MKPSFNILAARTGLAVLLAVGPASAQRTNGLEIARPEYAGVECRYPAGSQVPVSNNKAWYE